MLLLSVSILGQHAVRVVEVSDYYVINKFQLKFALNINVIILIEYLALSCKDIYTNCNSFSAYCVGYTFSSGQPVNQACPVTCNNCPAGTNPQKCTDSTYVCQNGGTCVNITSSTMFGYQCNCPVGYTGELCETSSYINLTLVS